MTDRHVFLLAAAGLLSACSLQLNPWFSASGNKCEWDEINYKGYFDSGSSAAPLQPSGVPEFGACSDEDLANSTCK